MSEMDGLVSPIWARAARPHADEEGPSPAELGYMAHNGHSGRVFATLRRLPPARLGAYASPVVLRQGLVGGLESIRSLPPADPARPEIVALVADLVDRQLEAAGDAPSRDLLRSLLDWTRFLFGEARLREAEDIVDRALEFSVDFPDLHGRVVLEKAACLAARGDHRRAYAVLDALYSRWDLVAERGVIPEAALALGRAALFTGRVPEFKRSLFRGLRTFYVSAAARRALFDLLLRAHRGGLRLLAGPAAPGDKVVFAAHWAGFTLAGLVPPARRLIERAFLAGIYAGRYVLAPPRVRAVGREGARSALVTRAMGGIGDLLMMTPGLHALRLRLGAPVRLAVPRRYFPLFEGNDDVELLDIRDPLQPDRWPTWFNLTDCPAARGESLASPRVRRNRIELFARALGVRGRALRRMDRRPRYFVSERERAERDAFFESRSLAGREVVGIQLRADESYRDYPHMAALVRLLSRDYAVLVFTDRGEPGHEWPGVVKVVGRPLREAFALASGCSVLVSPDSAFLHLGAALGVPAVALFGPTDGRVRAADYPLARALDARDSLRCVPCWRNEDIPCALTGARASVCMGEIHPAEAAGAVRAALRDARRGAQA
jgi:ADP-heptose:LPS heptosyltransferase